MEFITDYKLERYILDTKWESLPAEVQTRARVCAIDLMTALIVGSHGRQFQVGLKLAENMYRPGDIALVGSDKTFSPMGAVVAMSHASNSFDIDDGHNMVKGHPGTAFIAPLLTAALEKDVDYKEFLTTLVIAYDVAVRSGKALQEHYNFLHSTGTYGAVSSAAAMGRLYGMDEKQLNNAISIADFHAPLTPVMRAVEYPSMNKDGVPFGAFIGAEAVFETLAGETGVTSTTELKEENYLLDDLGQVYECMNLYFKPYTCCRWGHQPIAAGIDLMKENNISSDDIANVKVHTFEAATRLSKIVPHRADEAQYNIAFPVASALVHGDVGYLQVTEEALDNPKVLDMMKKLEFVMDPEMEAQFPEKRLAWIEITLKNGEVLKSRVYAAAGEHTDKVDPEWISAKFRRITKPFIAAEDQEMLIKLFLEGDLSQSIRDIVATVNSKVK